MVIAFIATGGCRRQRVLLAFGVARQRGRPLGLHAAAADGGNGSWSIAARHTRVTCST